MHVTSQLARRRAAATSLRPATSRAPASPRASYSTAAARRLRHAAQPRNPALRRGHSGLITILCMHGRLSVHRHTLSERAAGSVSPGWLMRHAVLPPPPLPLGRPAGGARWGWLAGSPAIASPRTDAFVSMPRGLQRAAGEPERPECDWSSQLAGPF